MHIPLDIFSAMQKSWRGLGSEANTRDEVWVIRTTKRKLAAIFFLARDEKKFQEKNLVIEILDEWMVEVVQYFMGIYRMRVS